MSLHSLEVCVCVLRSVYMAVLELPLRRFGCGGAISLLAIRSILLLFFGFVFTLAALAVSFGQGEQPWASASRATYASDVIMLAEASAAILAELCKLRRWPSTNSTMPSKVCKVSSQFLKPYWLIMLSMMAWPDKDFLRMSTRLSLRIWCAPFSTVRNCSRRWDTRVQMSQRKRACWSSFLQNFSWCFSASCRILCEL